MSEGSERRPVVLVVDDTPDNLGVLFDHLGRAGFEVLVAEDGESALRRVALARPDLILLDVVMPDMDGFATCERLKLDPVSGDIPVIFMTALTDTIDKVRGFEVGAVDYVTKPFQLEELLARLRTHLTIQNLRVKLQESEDRLSRIFESAMDAIVAIDAQGRITLFNGAAERVFRLNASEAAGTAFARLVSDRFRALLGDYMSDGDGARAAMWMPEGLTAVRADGEEFPVEATLSRAEVAAAPLFTIILRDIDERRRAEAERQRLEHLTQYLQAEVQESAGPHEPIGTSPAIMRVLKSVDQVAPTDSTVLLTGETGTGKEMIARAVHARSRRKEAVLVKVNCAAIPAPLIESDLFGHEKGAFTGALARKIGRFELAHGGTLFLDEIGELPLDLQPKLLRALENRHVRALGTSVYRPVDVRIIAATNRDLRGEVNQGRFRADLFFRLSVVRIVMPPVRQRPEDMELLVRKLLRSLNASEASLARFCEPEFVSGLSRSAWPGNVRELRNYLERCLVFEEPMPLGEHETPGAGIAAAPAATAAIDPAIPYAEARQQAQEAFEAAYVRALLDAHDGRVAAAAQAAGIGRVYLYRLMRRHGVAVARDRDDN